MSVQSVALASLTATYTDSEGEDGVEGDEQHEQEQRQENTNRTPREGSTVPYNNENLGGQPQGADSPKSGRSASNSPKPMIITSTLSSSSSSSSNVAVVVVSSGSSNNNSNTNVGAKHYNLSNHNNIQQLNNNAPTLVTDVTSRVQRLVSYNDDAIASDEEGNVSVIESLNSLQSHHNPLENGVKAFKHTSKSSSSSITEQVPSRQGESVSDGEMDEYGVTIPPEPPGQYPLELQEKINNLFQKMETGGLDMNQVIQQRKDFRNPSIYEKLIQFCSINELGTNYPPDRFDPFKWGKDSYYEELAEVQKAEMAKLEKARKEKTKMEIISGTVKRPNNSASNTEADDAKKRKSKWDQVATSATASVKPTVLLSQPTLTTLTSSATGTKATVISAFGSLPKKRL